MSTVAVFIALGGTSYAVARNSVGTAQLRNGAVTSGKVRDGSVATRDLAAGVLRSARGPRGALGPTGPAGATGPIGPPGPASAEAWKAISLTNGWDNYGGGWETASYRKDQLGTVHVRGLITRTAGAPGGTIAVLPSGYRPERPRIFVVESGETPQQGARVNVQADGAITWSSGATGETDFTSLDGISFDIDPTTDSGTD